MSGISPNADVSGSPPSVGATATPVSPPSTPTGRKSTFRHKLGTLLKEPERIAEICADIESGAVNVNERNPAGQRPLHLLYEMWGRKGGDPYPLLNLSRVMLEAGADVNGQDDDENSPLHTGVRWLPDGIFVELLPLLLSHGADVNKQNNNGYTPLHLAVANRKWTILDELLQANADVNIRCVGDSTPLHTACSDYGCAEGYVDLGLTNILRTEHTVNVQCAYDGRTPLHEALWTARWSVVDENVFRLLITDRNISYRDHTGMTPLHLALDPECKISPEIILLLATEETILTPDEDGLTPLRMAARNPVFHDIYTEFNRNFAAFNKRRGLKRKRD